MTDNATERKKFTMPGPHGAGNKGVKCERCDTQLADVYRTKQGNGYIFREYICPVPSCRHKNTTMERNGISFD